MMPPPTPSPTTNKTCIICGDPITGKYRKKCRPCIAKLLHVGERKWTPTAAIDDTITAIYMKRLKTKCSTTLQQYADKIGWPKHALIKRAGQLGLARTKEKPWSQEELALLEKNLWKSDARISAIFYQAGYQRTPTAIHIKITRTGGRSRSAGSDYYNVSQLAELFGMDSHKIKSWIKSGWLKARMKHSNRTQHNGGDVHVIMPIDVRYFIEQHPMDFDIRKVDQLWFMDLLLAEKGTLR